MTSDFNKDKADVLVLLWALFEDLFNDISELKWTAVEYEWFIDFINTTRTVGTNHGFHTSEFAKVLIEYREQINSLIGSDWVHNTEFNQVLASDLMKSIKAVQYTLANIQVEPTQN